MTIDNAWDEKWSEWIDWNGGECPVEPGTETQIKCAGGVLATLRPEHHIWGPELGGAGKIIAYRYKIKEGIDWPESVCTPEEDEAWQAKEREMSIDEARAILSNDNVNHPQHYQSDNGIECIDAIRAALGLDGFVAHCRGTAIKYCWRSGKKEKHAEDLRKAAWYLNEAAEALEE